LGCVARTVEVDKVYLLDVTSSMVGEVQGEPDHKDIMAPVVRALVDDLRGTVDGNTVLVTFSAGPCDLDGGGPISSVYFVPAGEDRTQLLRFLEGDHNDSSGVAPAFGGAVPNEWSGVAATMEAMRSQGNADRFWGLNTGILLTLDCALDILAALHYSGGDYSSLAEVLSLVQEAGVHAQNALLQARRAATSPIRAQEFQQLEASSWQAYGETIARIGSLLDLMHQGRASAIDAYTETHRQELVLLTDGEENVFSVDTGEFSERAQAVVAKASMRFSEMSSQLYIWKYYFGDGSAEADAVDIAFVDQPYYNPQSVSPDTFGDSYRVFFDSEEAWLQGETLWTTGQAQASALGVAHVTRIGEAALTTGLVRLLTEGFDIPGVTVAVTPAVMPAASVLAAGGQVEMTLTFSPIESFHRYLKAMEDSDVSEIIGTIGFSYVADPGSRSEVVFVPAAVRMHVGFQVPRVEAEMTRTADGFSLRLAHNAAYDQLNADSRQVTVRTQAGHFMIRGDDGTLGESATLSEASGELRLLIRTDLPTGLYTGTVQVVPTSLDPLSGLGGAPFCEVPYQFVLVEPDRETVSANVWSSDGGEASDQVVVGVPALCLKGISMETVGETDLAIDVTRNTLADTTIAVRVESARLTGANGDWLVLTLGMSPYSAIQRQAASLNQNPDDVILQVQQARSSSAAPVFFRQRGEMRSRLLINIDITYLSQAAAVELTRASQSAVLPGTTALTLSVQFPAETPVADFGQVLVSFQDCQPVPAPVLAGSCAIPPQDADSNTYIVAESCELALAAPLLSSGVYEQTFTGSIHLEATSRDAWIVIPGRAPQKECDIKYSFDVERARPTAIVSVGPTRLTMQNPWSKGVPDGSNVTVESLEPLHLQSVAGTPVKGRVQLTIEGLPDEVGGVRVVPSSIEGPIVDEWATVQLLLRQTALDQWKGDAINARLVLTWDNSANVTEPVELRVGQTQGSEVAMELAMPSTRPSIAAQVVHPAGAVSGTQLKLGDVVEGQRVVELSLAPSAELAHESQCVRLEYDKTQLRLVSPQSAPEEGDTICNRTAVVFEIASHASAGDQQGQIRVVPVSPVRMIQGQEDFTIRYEYRVAAPAVRVTEQSAAGLRSPGDVITRVLLEPNSAFLSLPPERRKAFVSSQGLTSQLLTAEGPNALGTEPLGFTISGNQTITIRLSDDRERAAGTHKELLSVAFPGIESSSWSGESHTYRVRSETAALLWSIAFALSIAGWGLVVLCILIYVVSAYVARDLSRPLLLILASPHRSLAMAIGTGVVLCTLLCTVLTLAI
jgi:hypothetical protein